METLSGFVSLPSLPQPPLRRLTFLAAPDAFDATAGVAGWRAAAFGSVPVRVPLAAPLVALAGLLLAARRSGRRQAHGRGAPVAVVTAHSGGKQGRLRFDQSQMAVQQKLALTRGELAKVVPHKLSPYKPGEGYGSNVIPFSGTVLTRGELGRMQADEYAEKAKQVGEEILRRSAFDSECRIPLPTEALELGGAARSALDELRAEGFAVSVGDSAVDFDTVYGQDWTFVSLRGSCQRVNAGALRLVAALTPPRAGLASGAVPP